MEPVEHTLQRDEYDLPSHDALAQILPHSRPLHTGWKTQEEQQKPAERAETTKTTRPNINHTYQVHHPHKRPPLQGLEDDDPHAAEITDLQTKELENYRSAMSRMAEDIVALRTQVLMLELENSELRSDLSLHRDLGQDLLRDTDVDVMTRAEIADRIATLKFKLASESGKTASQRNRIQQLQNELIRKNDSEKELIKLQRVQQQEQEDLQHHQRRLTRMKSLEVTVKQQEKVIEKMEKALDHSLKETRKQSGSKKKTQKDEADCRSVEMESALAAENARLRKELDRVRQQEPIVINPPAQTKTTHLLEEKQSLLSKLERAQVRIKTLEDQLEENAKLWGRQKQEMLTEQSEQRHGFVRTSTTILHNTASVTQ